MKERKCGCLYFEHGPPVLCTKHEARQLAQEEKGLRRVVREQAHELGHEMTLWSEYESLRGKWTAFCRHCGLIAIVYDTPPQVGDQVAGWCLTRRCTHSPLMEETDVQQPADTGA